MEHMLTDLWSEFHNVKAYYGTFLNGVEEFQLFSRKKDGTLQDVISFVNRSLSASKNRLDGLCLLKVLLQQCSTEVFCEYAVTWLRLLLPLLQPYESGVAIQLVCEEVADLIKRAVHFPELARQISNDIIPQLIPALISSESQWQLSAVECLCHCIQCFPGPCGTFKNKIETLVVSLLDTKNSSKPVSKMACKCYALLPGCGGGGNYGVKHADAWSAQISKVLLTMRGTINMLYENVDTVEKDVTFSNPMGFDDVTLSQPERSFSLQKQFSVMCQCLQYMLSLGFNGAVKIPIDEVVAVICQSLAVTGKSLQIRMTRDKSYLLAVLPMVHASTLEVLSSLIGCARGLILPCVVTISKLLIQTLRWTRNLSDSASSSRCYSKLRCQVYSVLCDWLIVSGAAAGISRMAEELVSHILADCEPQVTAVKLLSKQSTAHESKHERKKKKKQSSTYEDFSQLSAQNKVNTGPDNEVCLAALTALHQLLISYGSEMSPRQHKQIQDFILPLLLRVQSSMPAPYNSPSCRKSLYSVLRACVLCPCANWPSPTHCAVSIFSRGLQDPDLQVSSFCKEALLSCENVIHARMPSFNVPLTIEEETVTSSEEKLRFGNGHIDDTNQRAYEQRTAISAHQIVESVQSSSQLSSSVAPIYETVESGAAICTDGSEQPQPSTSSSKQTIEVDISSSDEGNDEDEMESEEDIQEIEVISSDSVQSLEDIDTEETGSYAVVFDKDKENPAIDIDISYIQSNENSKTGTKRKYEDVENDTNSRIDEIGGTEEAEEMLRAFVDAEPDSE